MRYASILAGLCCLGVTACANYQPLYSTTTARVVVDKVEMKKVKRNVGERRAAQRVSQRLRRSFPDEHANYSL